MIIASSSTGIKYCRDVIDQRIADVEYVEVDDNASLPDGVNPDVLFVFYDLYFAARDNAEIITNLSRVAGGCQWVQAGSAGWDVPLLASVYKSAQRYCNASGVHAEPLAQYALGHMLAHCKQFDLHREYRRLHKWEELPGLGELTGATVGIVGYGGIGRAVARLCKAFGMVVQGFRRSPQPDEYADAVYSVEDFDLYLEGMDYLVLCVPESAESRDFMHAERFAKMKESALLVNVGRGNSIVEADLIQALQQGHIAAAVVDTTRQEPLPADDPLWDAPNLYISAHDAAHSPHSIIRLVELFASNVERFAKGEALVNQVKGD